MNDTLRNTPLHDRHEQLGARMVPFAGWRMPVQYDGILPEHRHTREAVSLFDTCHMTQFDIEGRGADSALRRALACRVHSLAPGRCRYGFLLDERGGVLDDLIAYRFSDTAFRIVGNAGTREQDAAVLRERIGDHARFSDRSDDIGKIDLQGPRAADVLARLFDGLAERLKYFRFEKAFWEDRELVISRTGYTGELGYELYAPAELTPALWNRLLELDGVKPAGLGARDTLRLEAGLPLYGHELSAKVTPVEAGLGQFLPKHSDFIGAACRTREPRQRLIGVTFEGRRAAREGDDVLIDNEVAGRITSGSFAPSLGRAVAFAYVRPDCGRPGTEVTADVRGNALPGTLAEPPFYTQGTARQSL